jgi:hypothetical protein
VICVLRNVQIRPSGIRMGQRGVHFALLPDDVRKLREAGDDEQLLGVVQDDIEARWDRPWLFQTDKGWGIIHRCLTDGKLAYDNGEYPLRACVLGGEQLHRGDDYVVSLLTPEQVADVAAAVTPIDQAWLRRKFDDIDPAEERAPYERDFEYLWSCFKGLPEFFAKAASAGRAIIFTVDL